VEPDQGSRPGNTAAAGEIAAPHGAAAVGAHGVSAAELRQRACGSFGFQVPAFGGAVKRFGEQPPIFDFVTIQNSSNMFNCDNMIALRNDYN
jgi:hypothetical protein